MPFVITHIQNNSDSQQKYDIEFSPRADPGLNSPPSSMQQSPRSQKSSPYENRALFPLPEFQSQKSAHDSYSQTTAPFTKSNTRFPTFEFKYPTNLTSASDKGKIAQFATKVKEKYKRIDPNSSLRKFERKGYKDLNKFLKAIYKIFTAYNHSSSISIKPPVSARKFRMSRYSKVSSQRWII